MNIQLQDASKSNVVPIKQTTKIHLADFRIGSPEFELMKQKFKHPKAAVLLQHLEFLNRKYCVPSNGVFRSIYPSKNLQYEKTISGHIGIKSRRILFPILAEIREHYRFKKGVKLIPSEIDFKGKLYASYYLSSYHYRTVYWFRNAKLIDKLCAEIEREIVNLKQEKNSRHLMPREPACELTSELSSEPSGEPSYTKEIKKKEIKIENNKTKPLLKSKIKNKNSGEELLNKQNNNVVEGIKSKKKSKVKEEDTCINSEKSIYSFYKIYCKTLDEGILMAETPSVSDAKALKNFSKVLDDLGFKQHELPDFFEMLGTNHDVIVKYLENRSVWQVKNHIFFFNCAFLSVNAYSIVSWYKKYQNEASKAAGYHKSLSEKKNNSVKPKLTTPKEVFNRFSVGFTYMEHMEKMWKDERESLEYICVYFEKSKMQDDKLEDDELYAFYKDKLKQDSIDYPASIKRMKELGTLSLDELEQMPCPR